MLLDLPILYLPDMAFSDLSSFYEYYKSLVPHLIRFNPTLKNYHIYRVSFFLLDKYNARVLERKLNRTCHVMRVIGGIYLDKSCNKTLVDLSS